MEETRNAHNAASSSPAGAKLPLPPPSAADTSAVSRLQKELMSLMMSGDIGISAFPEAENIFYWVGTIEGSKGTPYEGLSYKLTLRFPLDYPFKPPQVKFENSCFHPNVDQCGNICLDILQEMWSSVYDIRTVLLSIQSLLGGCYLFDIFMNLHFSENIPLMDLSYHTEPNNDSPLNCQAAALWSNQEEYKKMVHKQYVHGYQVPPEC